MSGHQDVWRSEPDGGLAAEVGAFRLVVRMPEDARGSVRFVVLRRGEGDDGPPALVGSGTEPDVRTAMKKAAHMADRLIESRACGARSDDLRGRAGLMLPSARPARSASGRRRDRGRCYGLMFRDTNSRMR